VSALVVVKLPYLLVMKLALVSFEVEIETTDAITIISFNLFLPHLLQDLIQFTNLCLLKQSWELIYCELTI